MSSDDTTKPCSKCKVIKPRTNEFYNKDKRASDGLTSQCKRCGAAQRKEYAQAHPDVNRRASEKYRRKYPERYKNNQDRFTEKYPDRRKKFRRRWRINNPDAEAAMKYRRISKMKELPHTLTAQEWEDIKAEFNYSCAYCGKTWLELDHSLFREHVLPVSRGGGYTKDNIVPSCRVCNSTKHDRTPEEAGMEIRR